MHSWYQQGEERARLDSPIGQVEFARTIEILEGVLPTPPATVADIGGGPGRYTLWLRRFGYSVIHRDLVPLHVEQLLQVLDPAAPVDTAVADARRLNIADDTVDAVLLLGPLYHLPQRRDRLQALSEARRIAKPGAAVAVAAISRWAPRLDGFLVQRMYDDFPGLLNLVERVERDGVMPPLAEGAFSGYTHRPQDLCEEITTSGLQMESIVSIEGLAFALGDLAERLQTSAGRKSVLAAARGIQAVPELLGLGPHLLAVARAPGSPNATEPARKLNPPEG